MSQTFSMRLKEARVKLKLTQLQVEQHTKINNKTLSGYETGKSEPDYASLT